MNVSVVLVYIAVTANRCFSGALALGKEGSTTMSCWHVICTYVPKNIPSICSPMTCITAVANHLKVNDTFIWGIILTL